jgi:hypothetical protein
VSFANSALGVFLRVLGIHANDTTRKLTAYVESFSIFGGLERYYNDSYFEMSRHRESSIPSSIIFLCTTFTSYEGLN